jgi:hypothetical protein
VHVEQHHIGLDMRGLKRLLSFAEIRSLADPVAAFSQVFCDDQTAQYVPVHHQQIVTGLARGGRDRAGPTHTGSMAALVSRLVGWKFGRRRKAGAPLVSLRGITN